MTIQTDEILRNHEDPDGSIMELQRLILSYQAASYDDRLTVWAVLNKYAPVVDKLT